MPAKRSIIIEEANLLTLDERRVLAGRLLKLSLNEISALTNLSLDEVMSLDRSSKRKLRGGATMEARS